MSDEQRRGLLDTNILILRRVLDPALLPDVMAVCAVTLAELSAGVHLVREGQPEAHAERARRLQILELAEAEFDPLPFDAEAARCFGRVSAAVMDVGRWPRRRVADVMIAATAGSQGLPLYTTDPGGYLGLDALVRVVPVPRP